MESAIKVPVSGCATRTAQPAVLPCLGSGFCSHWSCLTQSSKQQRAAVCNNGKLEKLFRILVYFTTQEMPLLE